MVEAKEEASVGEWWQEARHSSSRRPGHVEGFRTSIGVVALLLSTISIAAQVLYLQLDALKGAAHIPAGVLDDVPIVGWLVGSNGGGWVVFGRAIGFHVAEVACCFVLAKPTENPEKRRLRVQREQRAVLELHRFERIAAAPTTHLRARLCGVRPGGACRSAHQCR